MNELGVAVIFPNVRGSSGFGKTFLKLDNGMKREDSVADIGALIDWIKQQPDLDARSHHDHRRQLRRLHDASLAPWTSPTRSAARSAIVGISNFVTFLERTESYRRDLRRVEYGDERDPEMRAWFEKMAPAQQRRRRSASRILVVQGKNDPRVPYTEVGADRRDAEEARHARLVHPRQRRGPRLREEAQRRLPVLRDGGVRKADSAQA